MVGRTQRFLKINQQNSLSSLNNNFSKLISYSIRDSVLFWLNFTECNNFKYGLECDSSCGKCLNGVKCKHVNGSCPNGCDAGVFGYKCDKGETLWT